MCKYLSIYWKGLPWILASEAGPGTKPLQIQGDDCITVPKPDVVQDSGGTMVTTLTACSPAGTGYRLSSLTSSWGVFRFRPISGEPGGLPGRGEVRLGSEG